MQNYRDIHRLAFQALFQIDAHDGKDLAELKLALGDQDGAEQDAGASPNQRHAQQRLDDAFALGLDAYNARHDADREMAELAPTWPAHRQAAADRAILRLGHFALTRKLAPGKAIINDAVALAKDFSTDKSPAFINALLDKVHKRLEGGEPQG
jgi:transcription termination factor NusB